MNSLTIVMYHYVRDLAVSRYPGIKGLSIDKFEGQLDYLARHYAICSMKQVVQARGTPHALPQNACLLTFDDGFVDHFMVVFPRLLARKWSGCFYPPAQAILERRIPDVHKIHFILAAASDHGELASDVFSLIDTHRSAYDLPSNAVLVATHAQASAYDDAQTVLLKRLLQYVLPQELRTEITRQLFHRHVHHDERVFANELYMDVAQLRCMHQSGMHVGAHGYRHDRFEHLSLGLQRREVDLSIKFLRLIHDNDAEPLTMTYPYGSYNEDTIALLRDRRFSLAMTDTTHAGLNDAHDLQNAYELKRLDTNDFPFIGVAPPCEWTRRGVGVAPTDGVESYEVETRSA